MVICELRKTIWQLSKINAFISLNKMSANMIYKEGGTEECGGMGTSDHRPVCVFFGGTPCAYEGGLP